MNVFCSLQVSYCLERASTSPIDIESFYCHSIGAVKFSSTVFLLSVDQFSITRTIYGFSSSLLRILQPQLMGEMISSFMRNQKNKSFLFNAAAIVLCSFASTLAFYIFSLCVFNICKRISIASSSLLYEKVRECC
jgi:hydrogenase-4 membrane subunit HyfE